MLPDLPHVAVFDTAFFHTCPRRRATYAIDARSRRSTGSGGTASTARRTQYVASRRPSSSAATCPDAEPDRAAPGQRRVGVGDPRRAGRGHLDGADPAGGAGDGHPVRATSIPASSCTCGARGHGRRRDRRPAQPAAPGSWACAGINDFRALRGSSRAATTAARLAYDVYIHRLRKYIGAYLVVLGGVDVIAFTAGVGENDVDVRRDALAGLEAARHRRRRRPQSRRFPGRTPYLGGRVATCRCWWCPPTRSWRSPVLRAGRRPIGQDSNLFVRNSHTGAPV